MLRADFYRLFHSKGFYITQLVLILVVAFCVWDKGVFSMTVSEQNAQEIAQRTDLIREMACTSHQAVMAMSTMAAFLIYFSLPLFYMTVGADLNSGTLKNIISSGMPRTHYFFSKYCVFLMVTALQFIFYYGTTYLVAGFTNGFDALSLEWLSDFIRVFLVQYLSLQGVFAVTMLVIFLTLSNVWSILATIVVPLVLTVVQIAYFTENKIFAYLNFQSMLNQAGALTLDSEFFLEFTPLALLVIAACLLIALVSFKQRDF
ncbi:hypothetical protein ODY47_04500 [Aerococcus urinae]|uniref:hypothetical protein n=1 Tax=Aerococcus urinae TaxID=1376 RepID=UPI00227B172A|nr:hypothetical protein [Aerococcus urinae]MCY3046358.1 hypothetical protein [Aerococcus urinae]